jgi:LPXTG-motif cell wall-anchored protein
MPGFTLGDQVTGDLTVANVGPSSVRFWGEQDTTSWPGGGTPDQRRFDKSLLPTGATRTLSVRAKPAWLIGFVTVRGQVVYPSTTESATTEITFSKRVLVVDPLLVFVVAGVLALAFAGWWVRRRRRRLRRHPGGS